MSLDFPCGRPGPNEVGDPADADERFAAPGNRAGRSPYRPPSLTLLGDFKTLNGTAPAADL